MTTTFTGFPREAVTFLAGLASHNDRAWFAPRKATYERVVVAPALAFVQALGAALQRFAPSVEAEPRVGGSLFRIQRDTRFAADKRPYKTHVGMRLRDRDTATGARCTGPLFYVELDATRLALGVGVKELDPATLAAYRAAVTGPRARVYRDAVRRAERAGAAILGQVLARPPRGYGEDDDPLVRRKGLFVRLEEPLPPAVHTARFVGYCARRLEPYADLFGALRAAALEAAGAGGAARGRAIRT